MTLPSLAVELWAWQPPWRSPNGAPFADRSGSRKPSGRSPNRQQQRRNSFRHLLQARFAKSQELHRWPLRPCTEFCAKTASPTTTRQADCRHSGGTAGPRPSLRARQCQRPGRAAPPQPKKSKSTNPMPPALTPSTFLRPASSIILASSSLCETSSGCRRRDPDQLRVTGFHAKFSGEFVLDTPRGESTPQPDQLRRAASDRVARMCGVDPGLQIVPFRGEYYDTRSRIANSWSRT